MTSATCSVLSVLGWSAGIVTWVTIIRSPSVLPSQRSVKASSISGVAKASPIRSSRWQKVHWSWYTCSPRTACSSV